jgi:ABC-2 type transport system permease protein
VALALQSGTPDDVVFGRYVRESALAVPLVILVFGSIWLFPLVTSLVAGDIVASEDHNGTLKTILTRSVDRGRVFAGKVLATATYTAVALLAMGGAALIAGGVLAGYHPLTSLSGTTVSTGHGFVLVAGSLGAYLIPMLGIAAIGVLFSTLFRNSAAAVVGTLMFALILQLVAVIPGLEGIKPYLLTTHFNSWQGLLREPIDWAPIVRATWVSALYAVPSVAVAYLVFSRRDVAGG